MKGAVVATSNSVDLVTVVEFLATIQRKEKVAIYQQSDYLRPKRKFNDTKDISYDEEVISLSCAQQRMEQIGSWEISTTGRIQVGQWYFKSKYN
jgi:hypothetical protein